MKFIDVLNESKKREDYLIIVNKEKNYAVINKDGKTVGKKMGYEKLEDALDTILRLTSKTYERADFYKQKNMIGREIIRFNQRNEVKEKKQKKKYGFYEIE